MQWVFPTLSWPCRSPHFGPWVGLHVGPCHINSIYFSISHLSVSHLGEDKTRFLSNSCLFSSVLSLHHSCTQFLLRLNLIDLHSIHELPQWKKLSSQGWTQISWSATFRTIPSTFISHHLCANKPSCNDSIRRLWRARTQAKYWMIQRWKSHQVQSHSVNYSSTQLQLFRGRNRKICCTRPISLHPWFIWETHYWSNLTWSLHCRIYWWRQRGWIGNPEVHGSQAQIQEDNRNKTHSFLNSLAAKEDPKCYKHHRHPSHSTNLGSSTSSKLDNECRPSSKRKRIYKKDIPWYNQEIIARQSGNTIICTRLCGWCNVVKITTEMLNARSGV